MTYDYELYAAGGSDTVNQRTLAFFEKYYPDDYRRLTAIYEQWDRTAGQNNRPPQPTDQMTVIPADALTDAQKLQYYCDCQNYGTGYTLCKVQDNRPDHLGQVYVPKGGTPNEGQGYFNDANGFLGNSKSEVQMIAIGAGTFKGVSNVVNMTIPKMIQYIGDEAFANAAMLQSITIANAQHIGNRAFKGCVTLATVNLTQGTETIGVECFNNTALSEIKLPDTTRKIGYGAFANCRNLRTVDMDSIKTDCEIGDYAFYDCYALQEIKMENAKITEIGEGAFSVMTGSQQFGITMPTAMQGSISDFLFAGRTGLQYVVFPQWSPINSTSNPKIGNAAFHDCANLQYVEFPAPDNAPTSCGFIEYDSELLFSDVINPNFYVKGPYLNNLGQDALPRVSTWSAKTAVSDAVPYLYRSGGKNYYEVLKDGYLLCIDENGILTSCTLRDKTALEKSGELIIPEMVGNTKVQGIDTDCFARFDDGKPLVKTLIIRDDSISTINDSVFAGWPELQQVYIGNSVTKVGNNAFKGCTKLVDVTFGSPANGNYAGFTIGTDAFKTESPELTFHGDIVEGYAPFEWATAPDNIIDSTMGIRVCYRSLSPSYLTVMYNPITQYVTLLDYPKYSQINDILEDIHRTKGDIGGTGQPNSYVEWREGVLYAQYSGAEFDSYRNNFAQAWAAADSDEAREEIYNDKSLYGPWISTSVVNDWSAWENGSGSTQQPPSTSDTTTINESGAIEKLTDFLFEPIVVYAAGETPKAYYEKFPYDVVENATSNDPYRAPTAEEEALVNATKNIVIPAGVDSIDAYGYRYNLDADGKEGSSQLGSNTGNYNTYFQNKIWAGAVGNMYLSRGEDVVPGLFSGTYKDYANGNSEYEEDVRGNDLIESVTMNSVKYLPDYAFDNCERLGLVVLGADCADIGKAPFRGCSRLQAVGDNDYYTTANGIVYSKNPDGSFTIEECLSARGSLVGGALISAAEDPNIEKVSAIKEGAFEDCASISRVDLSQAAGLLKIPESCFKNCQDLVAVMLPDSVNSIQSEAFAEDSPITVTIPGREVFIATDAFIHNDQKVVIRTYKGTSAHEYATYYKMGLEDDLGEKCLVTFLDFDGTELKTEYVDSDSYVEAPNFPTRDKWIYTGWRAANGTDIKDRIKADTIFVAQGYSTDTMVDGKYKVEFYDTIDFKVLSTQYVEMGEAAVEPRVPEHAGYSFVGWNDTFTNITSNKTIFTIFNVAGDANISGGATNTSGGTTNTSGGTTNTSGGTTNTSNRTTSTSSGTTNSSTSSSSTSATSTSGQNAGMYSVTVVNGSGSGTYAAGTTVMIMANEPAAGKQFSKWVLNSEGVTLANVSTTLTSFVMPSSNVAVTAEFIDTASAPTAGTVSTRPTGTTSGDNGNNNGNTRVDITKPGINNKDLATANVNGSTDNFIVKISETPEATQAVMNALTNKYGSLDNLLYYAMDISLYDSTGTTKITDTTGLTVDITIPLPDALITYGGNNMMGAVVSGQMEDLAERFTTINGVPCISFTATHFSPYTIYVNTQNLSDGLLDTTPKTGDPIHPKWFLSLGLACLSIILFMKRDRKVVVRKTA
ncbi:MAG: leucine-rich repeat protein [Lachnospiraceae bacterium]|nr:leucine-rich repeat protein [Lachnospiraceae bacterium]